MKIKLTQPDNVPNTCFVLVLQVTDAIKVRAPLKRPFFPTPDQRDYDANSTLIQTDWDYPGVANSFGGAFEDLQISEAYDWLCEHIGAIAEDPGYFETSYN